MKSNIENNLNFRLTNKKKNTDEIDDEDDSEENAPLTNMKVTDIFPVSVQSGVLHFVISMNYDYKLFREKHGKELEKMQKCLLAIAKYDLRDPDKNADPKPVIIHAKWLINDRLYHNYKIHRSLAKKNGSQVYYCSLENIFDAIDKKSRIEIKAWRYDFDVERETLICWRSELMS